MTTKTTTPEKSSVISRELRERYDRCANAKAAFLDRWNAFKEENAAELAEMDATREEYNALLDSVIQEIRQVTLHAKQHQTIGSLICQYREAKKVDAQAAYRVLYNEILDENTDSERRLSDIAFERGILKQVIQADEADRLEAFFREFRLEKRLPEIIQHAPSTAVLGEKPIVPFGAQAKER